MIEQKYIQTAIDYKKNVAGKFVLVEGAKLKQRIDGERFAVTRKIDGHMQVVFFVDGQVTEQREPSSSLERPSRDGTRRSQVFMLNASGKQKAEQLKCLNAFAEAVKAAGLNSYYHNRFLKYLFYDFDEDVMVDVEGNKHFGNDLCPESDDWDFYWDDDHILPNVKGQVRSVKMWRKDDFDRLVEKARKLGIMVESKE